ncbi:MAG: 16S rRNA (uracil(1498)-N(3))-methyltransferase [Deltaproteobacteria bacterium]|jgi:16S rRNA (uracil1498-N3)-methyltransferase|nr:16S rRNA (uracil(1498)-N(3))-methyltransferase [Deltaproteobacteria bacterium]
MRSARLALPRSQTIVKEGDLVTLDPAEARHGVLSLRLKPGDPIELMGPDGSAPARVAEALKGASPSLKALVTGPYEASPPANGPVLLLSLIRPARFEWAVEKGVELGASKLIPVISSRCRVRGDSVGASKLERWNRIAVEAGKQSGRTFPLVLRPPAGLSELLEEYGAKKDEYALYIMDGEGAPPRPPENNSPSVILVGPEGGFTPEEKQAARDSFFTPVSLGAITLRSETAALAALCILGRKT